MKVLCSRARVLAFVCVTILPIREMYKREIKRQLQLFKKNHLFCSIIDREQTKTFSSFP